MILLAHQSICLTAGPKTTPTKPKSDKSPEASKPKKPLSDFLQSSTQALHNTSKEIQSQLRQLHISLQAFIAKLVPSIPKLLQQLSSLQRQHNNSTAQNQPIQKILRDMENDLSTLQTIQADPNESSQKQQQIKEIKEKILKNFDDLNKYNTSTSDQPLKKNIEEFATTFANLLNKESIKSKNVTGKGTTGLNLEVPNDAPGGPANSVSLPPASLSTVQLQNQAAFKDNKTIKKQEGEEILQAIEGDLTQLQDMLTNSTKFSAEQRAANLGKLLDNQSAYDDLTREISDPAIKSKIEQKMEKYAQDIDSLLPSQEPQKAAATKIQAAEPQKAAAHKDIVVHAKHVKKVELPKDLVSQIQTISQKQLGTNGSGFAETTGRLETTREYANEDYIKAAIQRKSEALKQQVDMLKGQEAQALIELEANLLNNPLKQQHDKIKRELEDKQQELYQRRDIENLNKEAIERQSAPLKNEVDRLKGQEAEALRALEADLSENPFKQQHDKIKRDLYFKQQELKNQRTIENLKQDLAPYSHVIDSRGDGNCGYRAIMVSMLIENLHNKNIVAHLKKLVSEEFTTMFDKYDTSLRNSSTNRREQDVQTYKELQTYVLNKLDEINACEDIESIKRLIDHDTTFDYSMIMLERYKMLDLIDNPKTPKEREILGFFTDEERAKMKTNIGTWQTELDQPQTGLISLALETNIHTIQEYSTVKQITTPNFEPIELSNTQNNAYILFTKGHYKLLVKKHDQPAL
jgi:hypothetical protein